MGVKATALKVVGGDGWKERRGDFLALAEDIKRATNLIWRTWMEWHSARGHDKVLREWMNELKAWHEKPKKGRGAKPRCPLKAIDSGCGKAIYRALRAAFPNIHDRPLELARNATQKRIQKYKPHRGSFPGWVRVLSNDQRAAFSSDPQPIRFDVRNGALMPPEDRKDAWKLWVRLERSGGKPSPKVVLKLRTWGRHANSQRVILRRIADGEYEFKGSFLRFDDKRGEWYAHITYKMPAGEKIEVDPDRIGYLQPRHDRPWHFWIDGYPYYLGGRTGRHIAALRRSLLSQRWSRQESYKVATTARKGKGRQRALNDVLRRLRLRWQDAVKTNNEAMANEVLRLCELHKIGRVVYYQPVDDKRQTRFLSRAGKVPDREDASRWDWYQAGKKLQEIVGEKGVEIEVRKYGDGVFWKGNGRQTKTDKGVAKDQVEKA